MPYFRDPQNIEIYFEVVNDGENLPPLVFIHGYGSSLSIFVNQVKILQPYFKILLFDARNHGHSDKIRLDLQENLLDHTVQDVKLLINYLKWKNPVGVIAHSLFGCGIAQEFANHYPAEVRFLILLNGSSLVFDNHIRNVFWNLLPQFTKKNFKTLTPDAFNTLIDHAFPFITTNLIADNNSLDESQKVDLKKLVTQEIKDLMTDELDMSQIRCPTLLIGSELDHISPISTIKTLKVLIPHAEVDIVGMTGHQGLTQRFQQYNNSILRFLQNHTIIQ
ncbi:MAG: alpha/beta fold hydrolase [Promethearchaeota archaeon]